MCYDIKTQLETQLRRAKRDGDVHAIEEILEKLVPLTDLPIHHTSGFKHPSVLIYTNEDPYFPVVSTWGLIPFWVKDEKQKNGIWNKTLNARGETFFELPSFRDSAKKRRCLIHIDGFYEHHHFGGNTYPFFISRKDDKPLTLAGLWSEWTNKEDGSRWNTFSIVTTEGNSLMSKIHNNPKLEGPRMPLILPEELEIDWIEPYDENLWEKGQKKAIEELIQSYPEEELKAHTVTRLRGKEYAGNVPEISNPIEYEELVF